MLIGGAGHERQCQHGRAQDRDWNQVTTQINHSRDALKPRMKPAISAALVSSAK